MKRGFIPKEYERFFNLAQNIANRICSCLELKMLYEAKLERLELCLNEGEKVDGILFTVGERDIKISVVFDKAALKDEMQIAFCIAHELAHLLFRRFDRFADYCETDQSYAGSHVMRKVNGEMYGYALEEFLADYIAIDIVKKVYNIKKYDLIEHLLKCNPERVVLKNFEFFERIFDIFSQEKFEENDCYDAFVSFDGGITPKNLLLYQAVHGSDMSSLIVDYDKSMGEGAWKYLNQRIDKYYFEKSDVDLSKAKKELEIFSLRNV